MHIQPKPGARARPAPATPKRAVNSGRAAQGPGAATMSPQLRRLTAQVLDELKHPNAVPSVIIYKALEEAAGLRRT